MTLDLDNLNMFGTEGSGHQLKCWTTVYGKPCLIKLNSKFREASKEVSASALALACGLNAVRYQASEYTYQGKKRLGCICESFLSPSESSVSVYSLLAHVNISNNTPAREYFRLLANAISQYTGIPIDICVDYLMNIVTFDYLVCNPDRHLGNIEIVQDAVTGQFRLPPLFDFGQSFLKRDGIQSKAELDRLIRSFKTRPFSSTPERNLIDVPYAQRLCQQYLNSIAINYGNLSNVPAKEFHKQLFEIRVHRLMSLGPDGHTKK